MTGPDHGESLPPLRAGKIGPDSGVFTDMQGYDKLRDRDGEEPLSRCGPGISGHYNGETIEVYGV